MRRPSYISPTALCVWRRDSEEYFMKYLADKPPPKYPQTRPMAVGSAFDAYVKDAISRELGRGACFDELFCRSVEPQNRTWALEAGRAVFSIYGDRLRDLLGMLGDDVQMEISGQRTVGGIPLLGIPDLYWTTDSGIPVIHDWKVTGYCSSYPISPRPGYVHDWKSGKAHKDAFLGYIGNLLINQDPVLERVSEEWALQTATYQWIAGTPVGADMLVSIDQIIRDRIIEYRCPVSRGYQETVFRWYTTLWNKVMTGTVLDAERTAVLNTSMDIVSDKDRWLMEIVGRA